MPLTKLAQKHNLEPESAKAVVKFTLAGKAIKEGDIVYSPYHGEGQVTNGFDFTKSTHTFEVLFLRKHWNIHGSHLYANCPSEPDNLFWEPVPLIARPTDLGD